MKTASIGRRSPLALLFAAASVSAVASAQTVVPVIPPVIAPPVVAVVGTEFSSPGLECVRNEAQGDTSGSIVYDLNLALNASTTSFAVFRCPIQRRAPDTSSVTSIAVTVTDNNPAAGNAIECFVRSCSSSGSSCSTSPTVASGPGTTTLSLGSVSGDVNGLAYITCTVPPRTDNARSGVESYVWTD
jgi:hypothetical protein